VILEEYRESYPKRGSGCQSDGEGVQENVARRCDRHAHNAPAITRACHSRAAAFKGAWVHHTASQHIAPHRTAPHRTAPHRTARNRTAPHRTVSHRIASHRIASYRIASYRIDSGAARRRAGSARNSKGARGGCGENMTDDTECAYSRRHRVAVEEGTII